MNIQNLNNIKLDDYYSFAQLKREFGIGYTTLWNWRNDKRMICSSTKPSRVQGLRFFEAVLNRNSSIGSVSNTSANPPILPVIKTRLQGGGI